MGSGSSVVSRPTVPGAGKVVPLANDQRSLLDMMDRRNGKLFFPSKEQSSVKGY